MTNVLKKAFTWSIVAVTLLWSVGFAAFAPMIAQAAECPELETGDLWKTASKSAVYMQNEDGKALAFPNQPTFMSWGLSFADVVVLSNTCAEDMELGGIVPYAPGTLVYREGFGTVYVVGINGAVTPFENYTALDKVFGTNAVAKSHPVGDSHWLLAYNNTEDELDGTMLPDGLFVKTAGSSDVYFVLDGMLYDVEGTVPAPWMVVTVSADLLDSVEMADESMTPSEIAAMAVDEVLMGSGSTTPDEETPAASGAITVSLAASTPDSAVVPATATQIPYLSFTVKASEDTELDSIEFKRTGLGSSSNFDKVWLTVDGAPVSNDQSVNSDNTVLIALNGYEVKAGESVTLTLVGNLDSADTSNQDRFEIVSASMIDAGSADVNGSFPVRGNLMSYSSYSIGTTTIDDAGSDADVEVGEEGAVIGEFDLDFDSPNDSNAMVTYLRLKQEGDLSLSDLSNVALFENGEEVASGEVDGEYVMFTFGSAERTLEDGDTRSFEIRADIIAGDDAEDINFALDDNRDLVVVEEDTEYGTSISNTATFKTYTIDAGNFSVTRDTLNPSNEDYAVASQDVIALVAKVDAGQKVTVDGLKIYLQTDSVITAGTDSDDIDDINNDIDRVELYVGSKKISTLSSVTGPTTASNDDDVVADEYYYDFDSTFTLADNDLIKLVIDFADDADNNTYKFTFDSGDFTDPEYVASGDNIPGGNLSGTVTGNEVSIAAATFSVARNDGYVSGEDFIIGSQNNMFMRTLVSAGTVSAVTIRTLNFDFNQIGTSSSTYFQNLYVTIDGVQVGQIKDLTSASASNVSFTGLNKTIAKNGQATIALYGDVETGLDSNATTTITLDYSDSLVEDPEGSDLTWSDVTSPALDFDADPVLTASVDADTAKTALAAAGSATAIDVGTWRFDVTGGAAKLTDLYFANNSTTGSNTAETSTDFLVTKFQLVANGTVVAEKAPADGKVHFDLGSASGIQVAKDGIARVTLRAVLNSINNDDSTGLGLKMALYAAQADGSNGSLSTITGVAVTDTVAALDAAPTANLMLLVKTAPTLATVSSGLSSAISDGTKDVYKFSVTAGATGDVSWKRIVLDVTGTCTGNAATVNCLGATSSMYIKESGDTETATFSTSTGKVIITLDGVETIAAGTSKTYSFGGAISGFSGDNDALSMRVKDNESSFGGPDAYADQSSSVTFVWSDNAGTDASTTDDHWFNGYKVKGLDTTPHEMN